MPFILKSCIGYSINKISKTKFSDPVIQKIQFNRVISDLLSKTNHYRGGQFKCLLKSQKFFFEPKKSFQGISLLVLLQRVRTRNRWNLEQLYEYHLLWSKVKISWILCDLFQRKKTFFKILIDSFNYLGSQGLYLPLNFRDSSWNLIWFCYCFFIGYFILKLFFLINNLVFKSN